MLRCKAKCNCDKFFVLLKLPPQGGHPKSPVLHNSSFAEDPDAFLLAEFTDLARQCVLMGHPSDAIMFFNKALSIAPFAATIWFDKAQALGLGAALHETRLSDVCNCLRLAAKFSTDCDREPMAARSAAFILERCNYWHAGATNAWQSTPSTLELQEYLTVAEEIAQAMDCACKLCPTDVLLQQNKADFSQTAIRLIGTVALERPGLGHTAAQIQRVIPAARN